MGALDLDLIGLEVVMIMEAQAMVAMIMAQDLDLFGQEVVMIMEAMIMVQFLAEYFFKTSESNSIYDCNMNEFQFTKELKPSETLDVKISSVFVCTEINLV